MIDQRDALWNFSFNTYYDVFFQELIAEEVIKKLQKEDYYNTILIATASAASFLLGLKFWDDGIGRVIWILIAGFLAFLSIRFPLLKIQERLINWIDVREYFTVLRVELETLRQQMAVDPNFSIEDFSVRYDQHRSAYKLGMRKLKDDPLITENLKKKIESRLNYFLKDEILN